MKAKKCYGCHKTKALRSFSKSGEKKDGKRGLCKMCGRKQHKKYYKNNSVALNQYSAERQSLRRKEVRAYKRERFCEFCGVSGKFKKLEFHHINPTEGDRPISELMTYSTEKIEAEIKKCSLICRSCHRKVHHAIKFRDGVEATGPILRAYGTPK